MSNEEEIKRLIEEYHSLRRELEQIPREKPVTAEVLKLAILESKIEINERIHNFRQEMNLKFACMEANFKWVKWGISATLIILLGGIIKLFAPLH